MEVVTPMSDLMLKGRISFLNVVKSNLPQELLYSKTFVSAVWDSKTFQSLENIFPNLHKFPHAINFRGKLVHGRKACYAYHSTIIRAYEVAIPNIYLKDWFGNNYGLILVFRDLCETTPDSGGKECELVYIGEYIFEFLDSKTHTVKFFLLDQKTFMTEEITSSVLGISPMANNHDSAEDTKPKYIMKFKNGYTQKK